MNFPLSADFRPQALLAPRNEITDQSGGNIGSPIARHVCYRVSKEKLKQRKIDSVTGGDN
jgi:hypothetical protein